MFQPGQKVVCVNGEFHPTVWEWADCVPIEGETYTVQRVLNAICPLDQSYGPALHLAELVNPVNAAGREVAFSDWRFAPLNEMADQEVEVEFCLA